MSRKPLVKESYRPATRRPDPISPATLAAAATVRQKKGITLEQIANDTKIAIRSLRAIEEGDFGKLPGGIYNTNYVRQYARAIDFDEHELLAYYYRATGTGPAESSAKTGDTGSDPGFPTFGRRSAVVRS